MKTGKRMLGALLAALTAFVPSACARQMIGEPINPEKTQLYVGVYAGGYGTAWFDEIKVGFEKLYPDVQLYKKEAKEIYEYYTLFQTMDDMDEEVFFSNLRYHDYINKDKLLDITEVYEQTESGRTVEDRLIPEMKTYFGVDGRYYALPYATDGYQMIFDADLWDDYGFWMDDDGNFAIDVGNTFVKSKGQDGVQGTYDDGLPITYSQFFKLLARIKKESCVPFTWSGDYWSEYLHWFSVAIAAYYDNEAFSKCFGEEVEKTGVRLKTLPASASALPARKAGTFKNADIAGLLQEKTVRWENFEEIQNLPGVYYALCFAKDLMDVSNGDNFTKFSVGPGESHTQAQEHFLRSAVEPSVTNGRVAMLIDGSWWENEANPTFLSMAADYGEKYSSENRKFGIMPIPLPDDVQLPAKNKMLSTGGVNTIFAKKTAKHPDLCRAFLKYVYSEEGMAIMKRHKILTPFDFEDGDAESLSYYQRQRREVFDSGNVIYNLPNTELGRYFESDLYGHVFFESARYGYCPFRTFFGNKTVTPGLLFSEGAADYKKRLNMEQKIRDMNE